MTASTETSLQGNWLYPTQLRFGPGRIVELPQLCRSLGVARPLLVTDPGLAKLEMIGAALASLREEGLEPALFSDVQGNPTGANVEAGAAVARQGKHDAVIAFGGGSALDAGKAVAFLAGQEGQFWNYADARVRFKTAKPFLPIIAVPTTAGTGAEVSFASVITEEEASAKRIIYHPKMKPVAVIADPELTLGLPAWLTAATGMDALSHCIEGLSAPGFHPMSEGIALEGLRLIHDWLPVVVEKPDTIEGRAALLAAATMGAVAFDKGLGGVHALSHPIGAAYDTHHGLTNAVVLPYVLLFNRPFIEEKMARLARLLDLPEPGFDGVLAWVDTLRRRFQVPETLAELGVEAGILPELARRAANDLTATTNPRPLHEAACLTLYRAAFAGRRDGLD